jgi:hypothetical protein
MEVMRGFDGKAGLPNPAYQDYTQYRSVVLSTMDVRTNPIALSGGETGFSQNATR